VTFSISKDGADFAVTNLSTLAQKTAYVTKYDPVTRKFDPTVQLTIFASLGNGRYTVKNAGDSGLRIARFAPETSDAMVYMYFAENPTLVPAKGHYSLYDDVASIGQTFGAMSYVSAANNSQCEKCHGAPYQKHGYRAGPVSGLPDLAACKACHYDTRVGTHADWQCLVDDPAAYAAGTCAAKPEWASYAYVANTMNDTHMSHAMEFAYPQSMGNCVTCHAGKLGMILTDANFTLATCKSCHPVTGVGGTDPKRAPALSTLLPAGAMHESGGVPFDLYTYAGACNGCHNETGASSFSEIHSGYDAIIYADATGTRYTDAFKVDITDAEYDTTTKELTFSFTASETPDLPGLAVSDIVPTVLISMYGFDTKDFIVGAHVSHSDGMRNLEWDVTALPGTNNCDTNGDHVIDGLDDPCPEYARMAVVSSGGGTWTIRADLGEAQPTGLIDDGTIKRIEIGVIPTLHDAAHEIVALDMATRTFDLTTNAFDDGFYPAIVKVQGCNNCHDALSTTFHEPDRGGSVVGCRLCHTTLSGGSHLEGQSRSIDSYVHAIHAMQPFDIGDVNFADPVAALHYEHHIGSTYPNFTLLNCESCHNPGMYEVPTHAKSLPGILSKNDTVAGRALTIPGVVTGPGARACGSCHRVPLINEVQAAELAALDAHTAAFGYRDAGTTRSVFDSVIAKIQEYIDYLTE
jgi:OmcA/MtrC family decaheme c-type cytochrome